MTYSFFTQDFVQGAYNALEEDQNCSPYFKLYYNGKGADTLILLNLHQDNLNSDA